MSGRARSRRLGLRPVSRQSVAEAIAARLRSEILAGRIEPGSRLPSERDLARDFGTNRNTLREALRTLETLGLVRARQGDGVLVLDYRRDGELQVLPPFLTEGTPAERVVVLRDLLRLRRVLLVDMAAMAAERSDASGATALRERLADIRSLCSSNADPESLARADLAFYRELASATHSLVATWSFNTFARAYLDIVRALPSLWLRPPGYEETLEALVSAVEAHDATRTRTILDGHLGSVDEALKPLLEGWNPEPPVEGSR